MITVIFESHNTTRDNENNRASGHYDVELSDKGRQQSQALGDRYKGTEIDAIFCSDLQRSFKTAEGAFADRDIPTFQDERLRECDYGDLTRAPKDEVEDMRMQHITTPYPNGESLEQRVELMKSFLNEIKEKHDGQTIMIIGHRATRYALEHYLNNKSLEQAVSESNQWQPGWRYTIH
jgi:broad specificity phosphatase PhoE